MKIRGNMIGWNSMKIYSKNSYDITLTCTVSNALHTFLSSLHIQNRYTQSRKRTEQEIYYSYLNANLRARYILFTWKTAQMPLNSYFPNWCIQKASIGESISSVILNITTKRIDSKTDAIVRSRRLCSFCVLCISMEINVPLACRTSGWSAFAVACWMNARNDTSWEFGTAAFVPHREILRQRNDTFSSF